MELAFDFPKTKRIADPKAKHEIRSDICELCGEKAHGEPHHIKTRGSGGSDIRENQIQLCVKCHIEAQEYKIKPLKLIQIVAKREEKTVEQIYEAIGWPAPEEPPQEEPKQEEPSLEEMIQAYINLEEQETDCKWIKAQLLNAMVEAGAKASWIASQIGSSAALVREMAKVYRAFPKEHMRVPDLSFYHHRLAASTSDPVGWITRASNEQMSTREMRKVIIQADIENGKIPPPKDDIDAQLQGKAEKAIQVIEEVLRLGGEPANWLKNELKKIILVKHSCNKDQRL